jgi:putrescine importer
MASASTGTPAAARLRRTLTLWDLILYGVIVIQPVAPMSVFGVLSERGHGHVVTTILIAMVAMLFTAISYGRMARAYPSAGSAFTYVGQEINPALGYVTGWSMVMDYLLNPMICIIWISQQAHVFAPGVPYGAWAVFFALVFTALNVQGVKTSARVNTALAAGMGVVIAIFFVAAARYIFGNPHDGAAFFTRPFYDPQMWNTKAVLGGASIAVLTYIGFDGISTLSEEAANPRRNILLATVLVCVVIGILSAVEVYAAQLVWPASQPYPNVDTAFTFVAGRAWAPLFAIIGFTLVVANFGSGMGAQLGAVPRNNVLFVGALALAGAFFLPWVAAVPSILARFLSSGYSKDLGTTTTGYELGANLLNFGALIAFMGVNAAAFVRYYLHEEKKKLSNLLPPVLGFVICLFLWLNLSTMALIFGAIWMAVGIAFGAWKTKGFRGNLVDFELPPEEG